MNDAKKQNDQRHQFQYGGNLVTRVPKFQFALWCVLKLQRWFLKSKTWDFTLGSEKQGFLIYIMLGFKAFGVLELVVTDPMPVKMCRIYTNIYNILGVPER